MYIYVQSFKIVQSIFVVAENLFFEQQQQQQKQKQQSLPELEVVKLELCSWWKKEFIIEF